MISPITPPMRRALFLVALVAVAVGSTANAARACSTGALAIPSSYITLYKTWSAETGVPWSLLAAVGSVESGHGSNPLALVPHNHGVLGPMQFQAGSNKLARKQDGSGDQGFGGTWGLWRTASGHPPYRMDDPDDEIAAAAAKLRYDAGPSLDWTRALYHYNALGAYVSLVLKREKRYRLGTCSGGASSEVASPSDSTAGSGSAATAPNASVSDLLEASSVDLAPAAASDLRQGIVDSRLVALLQWIAQRHSIAISEFRTGHPKFVAGTSKISNNWYGRATTITWVDGSAVSPGSAAARALWQQLRTAPASIRPTEIGAPWADPVNPRYYSGPDAVNLIHIGFDAQSSETGP
jgi:hypothetical protein